MSHESYPAVAPLRRYVLTWAALLILLLLTVGSAFIPMGSLNVVANLAIAVVKALLVLGVFMQLLEERASIRLAAATGFFFVLLFVTLSLADYLTR